MEGDNAPSIRLPAILSPLLRGDFEDRPAQSALAATIHPLPTRARARAQSPR